MQFRIPDTAAIELSQSFYEAIAGGLPGVVVAADGRKAISIAVSNKIKINFGI